MGEAGIAPAEDETSLCSVDLSRAARQLHPCFPRQRHGGKIRRGDVREPVLDPLQVKPIVGEWHTCTVPGRPPEPGRCHPAACDVRQFYNVGGHIVEECLTIPAHLDRVAGARAAAPIRRRGPGDLGAHAVGVVDRGGAEQAGHRTRLWDRGGGAARLVQGDDVKRGFERRGRSRVGEVVSRHVHGLHGGVRGPADFVVERVDSDRRGFFDCPPVGSGRHRFPSILVRHPLLERAPANVGHDEALGTLPEEVRCHQFDRLPTRGVEHHRDERRVVGCTNRCLPVAVLCCGRNAFGVGGRHRKQVTVARQEVRKRVGCAGRRVHVR